MERDRSILMYGFFVLALAATLLFLVVTNHAFNREVVVIHDTICVEIPVPVPVEEVIKEQDEAVQIFFDNVFEEERERQSMYDSWMFFRANVR